MTITLQRNSERIRSHLLRRSFTARRPTDTERILGDPDLRAELLRSRQDVLRGQTRSAAEVFMDIGW